MRICLIFILRICRRIKGKALNPKVIRMARNGYTIEEYEEELEGKIKRKELKCSRCENEEDFMVNEIGHVFCNKCHEKIRFVRWSK